jgi:site-specific recombinase XerD
MLLISTGYALVVGKGDRPRVVLFGDRCRVALTQVPARARQAGRDRHLNAHQLRHYFAHNWLAHGGQEQDVMMLAGWRSRQMLARYGASVASEGAREAHRRVRPGDAL